MEELTRRADLKVNTTIAVHSSDWLIYNNALRKEAEGQERQSTWNSEERRARDGQGWWKLMNRLQVKSLVKTHSLKLTVGTKTQQPRNSQSRSQIDRISRSQPSSANTRVFTICPILTTWTRRREISWSSSSPQSMFASGKCVLSFKYNLEMIVFLLVMLRVM